MKKSEQQADLALETVAGIEKQIRDAEALIRAAEEELKTAQKDALKAKENAQEAENKYAITASQVGGFFEIIDLQVICVGWEGK